MNSSSNLEQNLEQAHALLLEAVSKGSQLVAFPEYFLCMPDQAGQLRALGMTPKHWVIETLCEWAVEHDQWILGGTLPLVVAGDKRRVTNTSLMISNEGEVVARYDKIHLFDAEITGDRAYRESVLFSAGKRPVVAETPFGRAGLSVCYDLRFPELYRIQSAIGPKLPKSPLDRGVLAIFAPSAFTATTGRAHWDVLTRSRAIENQAYLIAPAQCGKHGDGRETHGHARIIDPWGRVIAERPAGPGVVLAELQHSELERVRRDLPALSGRRL